MWSVAGRLAVWRCRRMFLPVRTELSCEKLLARVIARDSWREQRTHALARDELNQKLESAELYVSNCL
jgi:hypothetical protein